MLHDLLSRWKDPKNPAAQLERVRRGGLTSDEREEIRTNALDSLHGIEWSNHCEDSGCVVTGPRGVGEEMRAERDESAEWWRLVLAALEAA